MLLIEPLLRAAERILRTATGQPVVLTRPRVVKDTARSLLVRCRVEPPAAGGHGSVVVRQIKADAGRGFSDWAGLAFLSAVPGAAGLAPLFLGGDREARVVVMEDLGPGRSLHDLLSADRDDDGRRPTVGTALPALAAGMARLHTATVGREETYAAMRAALPEADGLGRAREADTWLQGHARIIAWFEALDRTPPTGLRACMAAVAEVYRRADGFLAFTHGDPAPSNNHIGRHGARLVDFEYGGYRHALYDVTAWHVLCPLPAEGVAAMRRAFREELSTALPAARDDARFDEAWATLCVYRALALLSWISPSILTEDKPWAEAWSAREALLVALARLEEAGTVAPVLRPAGEASASLSEALRSRWPQYGAAETLLPRWAAFDRR